VRDFGSRHGLAVCAAELCSVGRITGFNRMQCQKCFEALRDSYEENILEIPEEPANPITYEGHIQGARAGTTIVCCIQCYYCNSLPVPEKSTPERQRGVVYSKFVRNQKLLKQYNEETL